MNLKLLQFDPGIELACKVMDEARLKCVQELVYRLRDIPEQMTDVCGRIRLRTERAINLTLRSQGKKDFGGTLRVSLFTRSEDDRASLVAEFQAGFEHAHDERIRLPIRGSIVGQSLEEEDTLYLERRDPSWPTYLARPHDRWLRKLICPNLKWVLSVPYVKLEDGIEIVVAIDSDEYIEIDDDLVDVTLGSISEAINTMLAEYLPKEGFARASSQGQ